MHLTPHIAIILLPSTVFIGGHMNTRAHGTSGTESWQSFATGIAWGSLFLLGFIIIAVCVLITGISLNAVPLPMAMTCATMLIYMSFTVVHEAGHGNIVHEHKNLKWFERLVGWVASVFLIAVPFGLWARIHDHHHAFTNNPQRDPDYWVGGDSASIVLAKSLTLVPHYLYVTLFKLRNEPVFKTTHLSTIIFYGSWAAVLTALCLNGFAFEVLTLIFIPTVIAALVLALLFDWIPHTPMLHQGRYHNTRVYLGCGLNAITLGQNYHLIHHLYPRVPWYKYRQVFKLIRPELEKKEAIIEDLFSGKNPGLFKSKNARRLLKDSNGQILSATVDCIKQETKDAITINIKNINSQCLSFKAGQYVTVSAMINHEYVTRCYSICQAPFENQLAIGIKRSENGLMSNYLHDHLKAGQIISLTGPFGEFVYPSPNNPPLNNQTSLVLIAGGSGITPILAILKSALHDKTQANIQLIYANKSLQDAMYIEEIIQLQQQHPDRFTLTPIYQQPAPHWQGLTGYLTAGVLTDLLLGKSKDKDKQLLNSTFYICGPDTIKSLSQDCLSQLGIKTSAIFIEDFTIKPVQPIGERYRVEINLLNGEKHRLNVAENQTVLQVAKENGITLPSACGMGQCGCCKMNLVSGSYHMSDHVIAILPQEKASGTVLTCQCHPMGPLILKE